MRRLRLWRRKRILNRRLRWKCLVLRYCWLMSFSPDFPMSMREFCTGKP